MNGYLFRSAASMPCHKITNPATSLLADHGPMLTDKRLRHYPIALLAVTVLTYLVSVAGSTNWIEPGGNIVGRDFLAFYMAGDMVNQGRWDQLYSLTAQTLYQDTFMEKINPNWSSVCLYLNPPHYAWGMSWVSHLGYGKSLLVWWLFCLGCFGGTALIWRRWLGPGKAGWVVLLILCMPAWFQAMAGGQNTFLSLLILTAFCALLMKGRDGWAGVVLSLLAFKFQLMIVPAGWLLLSRRWRTLGGLAIGGGSTLALTIWLCGIDSVTDYARFVTSLGEVMPRQGFDVHKQHSWYGLFFLAGHKWLPMVSIQILTATASIITLLFVGEISRGVRRSDAPRFALTLCALMIGVIATSPHLFHYDMLLVALPAVLWIRATCDQTVARATSAVKPILVVGFIWLAIAGPLADATHVQWSPVLMLAWIIMLRRAVEQTQAPRVPYVAAASL